MALGSIRRVLRALVLRSPLPEALFQRRARRRLTVIAYHRVMPLAGADFPFDEDLVSCAPEEFERELDWLRRRVDVLSVAELADGLDHPGRLPARPALITFDDGYADNHEVAFPALRARGLPACFFLCTGLVGTDAVPWWDQLACAAKQARIREMPSPFADDPPYRFGGPERRSEIARLVGRLKREPWARLPEVLRFVLEQTGVDPARYAPRPLFMSWDAARAMRDGGMTLGGHTRTHPVLSRLDPAALGDEIAGCRADLERELGEAPLAFAYPVGGDQAMSAAADAEIARAGFRLSFSYVHAFSPLDPRRRFGLPRVHAEYGADHHAFRLGMARVPLA